MPVDRKAIADASTAAMEKVMNEPGVNRPLMMQAAAFLVVSHRIYDILDGLEKRIDGMDQRRTMAFEGAHDPARSYRQGDVVQRSAGVWVCMAATSETPGASANWRRIGDSR